MKIIVGTPRSGTSFVAQWYANEYTNHKYLLPEKLGEWFDPEWFDTGISPVIQTIMRWGKLNENNIFKVHTGMPKSIVDVWSYIENTPVILVKRKDILGQFISFGIGRTTERWVNYNRDNRNGLNENQIIEYKQEWFDDLANRIIELEELEEKKLVVERLIWFEDLPNFKVNGKLPRRQNGESNEEKLKLFTNGDEIIKWYENFNKR
tara:strand:- start:3573 stop:4193 length:621 start_codon:yes stop_codon:yes gene_type:complete